MCIRDRGSSGPVTWWRQLVSCDWSWHSHGSLTSGKFELKIKRSMKTPWQEYGGVACSYSSAPAPGHFHRCGSQCHEVDTKKNIGGVTETPHLLTRIALPGNKRRKNEIRNYCAYPPQTDHCQPAAWPRFVIKSFARIRTTSWNTYLFFASNSTNVHRSRLKVTLDLMYCKEGQLG